MCKWCYLQLLPKITYLVSVCAWLYVCHNLHNTTCISIISPHIMTLSDMWFSIQWLCRIVKSNVHLRRLRFLGCRMRERMRGQILKTCQKMTSDFREPNELCTAKLWFRKPELHACTWNDRDFELQFSVSCHLQRVHLIIEVSGAEKEIGHLRRE